MVDDTKRCAYSMREDTEGDMIRRFLSRLAVLDNSAKPESTLRLSTTDKTPFGRVGDLMNRVRRVVSFRISAFVENWFACLEDRRRDAYLATSKDLAELETRIRELEHRGYIHDR